jgi:hypothetical protein
VDGDGSCDVEISLRLPSQHHIMEFGWQERARIAAERKLNGQPFRRGQVINIELWELDQQ